MAERVRHITTTACMENGLLSDHDAVDYNYRMPGDSRNNYWLNLIRVYDMYLGDRLLKNSDNERMRINHCGIRWTIRRCSGRL